MVLIMGTISFKNPEFAKELVDINIVKKALKIKSRYKFLKHLAYHQVITKEEDMEFQKLSKKVNEKDDGSLSINVKD